MQCGCIDAVFKQNLKHVCLERFGQKMYWNLSDLIIIETNVWIHWSRRVFAGASRSVPHGCRPMPTDPSLRQNVRVATTGSASLETGHLPVAQREQICKIYTRHKQQLQCNSECYKKELLLGKQNERAIFNQNCKRKKYVLMIENNLHTAWRSNENRKTFKW